MNVVWFKRDLRVKDHDALATALALGSTLPLYIIEPELWQQPDRSWRQWRFLLDSLTSLDEALRAEGGELCVRVGNAVEVLETLRQEFGDLKLHAHEETGTRWTDQRDIAVRRWCKDQQVPWQEQRQFGVFRALRQRDGWAGLWKQQMRLPLAQLPTERHWQSSASTPGWKQWQPPVEIDQVTVQAGGIAPGRQLMHSFFSSRGEHYHHELSSPQTAEDSCSRLSTHLSLGTVSIRELAQRTWRAQTLSKGKGGNWSKALKAFEGRLHWHCHFIQKLESETRIEFENLDPSADGLREDCFDTDKFHAWQTGQTGFPLVDACMRYLNATGWLNFRMRAMLVSFASYQLWLHWRQPALHLARMFTDYEAGIHFSQMQMQSGTTGINALRIYNPIKQSFDQDPSGQFVRTWVPELAGVSDSWIHEPWRMTGTLQANAGCSIPGDYPAPVVDPVNAARAAKARMAQVRRPEDRGQRQRIAHKHGSRRRH
ncbi:MAG: deoxyribodipyrimidine photo-lyase/cryptochrome family protein [Lysobacterales bacterium]